MAIKSIKDTIINKDKFIVDAGVDEQTYYTTDPWFRNPCWLPLPSVNATEQKFVGLIAVDPDVNDVRLQVEMDYLTDTIQVDWGDGVVETFTDPATNLSVTIQHSYDYSNVLFNNTDCPVTFTASTNIVNRNSHGFTNGMTITFAEIVTTPDINRNQTYWVVNATTNSFQVAKTKNGTAVDITIDGTGKILPYKQAIVTVTAARGRITLFSMNIRHTNLAGPGVVYDVGWLDIAMSFPYTTSINIASGTSAQRVVSANRLEQVAIYNAGISGGAQYLLGNLPYLQSVPVLNLPDTVTAMPGLFFGCRRLKTIPTFNTKSVQDFSRTFEGCISLEEAPFLDTSNATNLSSMFYNCYNLKKVPLYDTRNNTNMSRMFSQCYNIKNIPEFNTERVITLFYCFELCTSLENLPYLNTKSCYDFTQAFSNCYMLRSIQGLDMQSAYNITSMFVECNKLEKIPDMDVRNVVNASSAFSGCYSLRELPKLDFQSLVQAASMFIQCVSLANVDNLIISSNNLVNTLQMFYNCYNLERIPAFNTSKVVSADSMFYSCLRLTYVPDLDLSSCYDFSNMFLACSSLERAPKMITTAMGSGTGINYTKQMDGMFTSCVNLKYVPPFDTSKASTVNSMFYACNNLETIQDFDLSMCTSTYRMFRDCWSLKKVGKLTNTTLVTNASEMFYICTSLQEIPAFNYIRVTSAANLANAHTACNSVSKFRQTNIYYSFSVASSKLSATELNALYTSLPTVTGQTITVTGNWGTAADNPSIATAKGWTVTG